MTSTLFTVSAGRAAAGAGATLEREAAVFTKGSGLACCLIEAGSGNRQDLTPPGRTSRLHARFLAAVARRDALLLRVLVGRLDDQRADHVLVGRDPAADDLPALAVPGLELGETRAFVIVAGHVRRRHQPVGV